MILPDNVVLPANVLLPTCIVEPVINKEPVIIALPIYGKVMPPPPPLPAFKAYDAVKAYDALTAVDILPLKYEADSANVANDAVPNNDPVIPLVTFNDPLIVASLRLISPFLAINSLLMFISFPIH